MPLVTPEFRASYAYVFEPHTQKNDDGTSKREYTITAIFPKGADLKPLMAAATEALTTEFGPDKAKWPQNMRNPFRKCSERWKNEGGKQTVPPGYEEGDAIFMTYKSNVKYQPQVVGPNPTVNLKEPREFYSGCYARASLRPFVYDKKGNRGVSFGLQNVQKTRDGDPLGGTGSRPTDDFTAVEGAAEGTDAASIFA